MSNRNHFEKIITEKSKLLNVNGYVSSNQDNLIKEVTLDLFQAELDAGSGHELKSKFNALYSSSALAVNSFALIKTLSTFEFIGYKNFNKINFERQFSTGLKGTPPNLDFALENEEVIIGFESKYLEPLDKKKVNFKESYNEINLAYLDKFWFELIEKYNSTKSFLDVAQLVKHSIGMINQANGKKVILVYIYWTPRNKDEYQEYEIHQEELDVFSNRMNKQTDIEFLSMTYDELWTIYDKITEFVVYSKKLRERYEIEI